MQVNPMLRAFLRLFSSSPQRPSSIHNRRASSRDPVVLYAHSDHPSERVAAGRLPKAASERVNHRARLMSMRLEHTRLCSQQRCKRLREYGILTAGDMATADPKQIAQKFAAPQESGANSEAIPASNPLGGGGARNDAPGRPVVDQHSSTQRPWARARVTRLPAPGFTAIC